jgi:hypothetical protein
MLVPGVDDGGFNPGALHLMTCSPPGVANQRKRALTLQLTGGPQRKDFQIFK